LDDLIGKAFGPCVLKERIGSGGMAVVYRGYQESLDRYVAVKVLQSRLAKDPDFVTRFRREALAVARLSHPNILHVHDAGLAHGAYYIVMDLAVGGTLQDQLAGRPLGVERARTAGIQLAEALDYAHRQGLVHRDVKPSNVLIDSSGRYLLTDFGIAKALHGATSLTRTGESIGTPEYMAPEQVTGGAIDARTDVYALGVVLYEMLAGCVPFRTSTPMATLYKHVHEEPAPLRSVNPAVPAWLEAVVHRALAKNPAERFQRAGEMARALRAETVPAAAVQVPVAARRVAPGPSRGAAQPTPTPQPAQQNSSRYGRIVPMLVAIIAILTVAIFAVSVWLVMAGRGESGQTLATSPGAVGPTATSSGREQPATAVVVVITSSPVPTLPATATLFSIGPSVTPTAHVVAPDTATPDTAPTGTPLGNGGDAGVETGTQVPLLSPTPNTPTPTPTRTPTKRPPTPTRELGVITGFEQFGRWRRGDEANGTFTQSDAEAYSGRFSGRLDYSFDSPANDYVVFRQTQSIPGTPERITAQVYGDGSNHFLNVWIQEKGGQVWQVPLGRVDHTGWGKMEGLLTVEQEWPWAHISGTDDGTLDFPVSFVALVLDDAPDPYTGSGTIYIDDLRFD
jgi:serine/threonine-protein kinase